MVIIKLFLKIIGYFLSLSIFSSVFTALISMVLIEKRTDVLIELGLIFIGLMLVSVLILYFIFRIPAFDKKDRYFIKTKVLGSSSFYNILSNFNYEKDGVGSRFYDFSEIKKDGSFVTTKWISAIYFPVVPLYRFRIINLETNKIPFLLAKTSYKVMESGLPLDRVAIAKLYRKYYLFLLPALIMPAMILIAMRTSTAKYIFIPHMTTFALIYVGWIILLITSFVFFHMKNEPKL